MCASTSVRCIPLSTQLATHASISHSNCCATKCAYQSLHSEEKPGRRVTETTENNDLKATCITWVIILCNSRCVHRNDYKKILFNKQLTAQKVKARLKDLRTFPHSRKKLWKLKLPFVLRDLVFDRISRNVYHHRCLCY